MTDPQDGTSHSVSFQGKVTSIDPPQTQVDGETPASQLQVLDNSNQETLFYTLPTGFYVSAFPNDWVQVLYRQNSDGSASSYGARIEDLDGHLIAMFVDGEIGPALLDSERLGFTFALDTTQPLATETTDCGTKLHYPVMVTNGSRTKRLFDGQSETYTLADGEPVTFTLFDAWRLEDPRCPAPPDYAIGYVVEPAK